MSRLIDADVLIEILTTAIRNMKGMAKFLNAEDDPEIKMEIKAYTDILDGVKEQPTIEPLKAQDATGDTISRQATLDLARDICIPTKDGPIYRHRCIDPDAVRELPSAQPEIVRCKDCKYWREYKYTNGKPKYLPYCGFDDTYFREDDFCSRAERRTDD